MGTGDPLAVWSPANYDGAWRVVARSVPRRLVCPGWFLPGRVGTRTAIWRQKNLLKYRVDYNEIDWGYKAC